MKRAVFLDRDGTLIVDKDYLHRPEEVELIPGTGEALKALQEAGFTLVMVTNQSGVGRGYFSTEDVDRVHRHLTQLFARNGVEFAKIYVAPEAPDQPSYGRKPSPQFLFEARETLGIDLSQSFIVGDKMIDLECGWNAGVRQSVLVRTGYGAKTEKHLEPNAQRPVMVVDDMPAAAQWIIRCSNDS